MLVPGKAVENLQNDGFLLISIADAYGKVLNAAFEAARHFFRSPLSEKNRNKLPEDCGYRPMGIEYSQSSDRPDPIESFTASSRTWLSGTELQSASARILFERMLAVINVFEPIAQAVTIQIAEALSGRAYAKRLSGVFGRWSCLQVNYSRPADVAKAFINDLHEDGNLITVACATGPGLEVRRKDGLLIPIIPARNEVIIMPGEIAFLLSGGQIPPLYHCVRPAPCLHERMALLFFGDIDPKLCDPWIRNEVNANVDIGKHVLTNATRFGLLGFAPD